MSSVMMSRIITIDRMTCGRVEALVECDGWDMVRLTKDEIHLPFKKGIGLPIRRRY